MIESSGARIRRRMRESAKMREWITRPTNKFERIAVQYLPRGYSFAHRKSLSGRHYGNQRLIVAPRPATAKSLYIFLHECAHAYLHTGSGSKTPRHIAEMEAELWAHAKMEKHGIPVPPEYTERARRYVAYKIMQAERRGAKNIDPRAREFAGEARIAERHAEWEKALGKSNHPGAVR